MKTELKDLSGVGPATITKLEDAGICSIMGLATSAPMEVATVSAMSESAARKLIKLARETLSLGFEKAKEYSRKRDRINKIGTGCTNFDEILGGGFESASITEIYSQYGCGKTQLSHLMVVRSLLEDANNKAIFIDSEGTFRGGRIKDFAEANGMDTEDVMDRIYVARAYNSDHQMLLVDEIEKLLQQDNTYRIVVVDSLTSHFRSEYVGRGTLASRQQKLNKHMHQLLKLADIYNMIILVTNQVSASPGAFYGDPTVPVGGHIVGHASTFRIYMRPGKKGTIFAKMVDSPNLPNNDCNFNITKEGFVNA